MAKNRIKLYWLFLLTLMYTACFVLSIGQAQARYENTVTAGTMVESSQYGLTSDCMVKKGDPSLTVLLGELSMQKTTEVSFWLKSHGAPAAGKLAWSVSDPELAQYLRLNMKVGPLSIDPDEEIELMKDIPMAFTLTMTPTDIARSTAHGILKINVLVTWGEEMWGTFQIILPEVKEKEETSEESEDPDGTSEDEKTEEENTHEEDPVQDNSEEEKFLEDQRDLLASITGNEEEDSDQPEPSEEQASSSEGTDQEDESENSDETKEPDSDGETETTPEDTKDQPIRLETLSRFDPAEKLPLKIVLTDNITSVRLGVQVTEEEETRFEPFPDYTRFSLDRGKSYYMMYDGYIAEFAIEPMTSLSVLLDFSNTKLAEDDEVFLAMQAYEGETLVRSCQIKTTADAMASCQTLVHPINQETQAVNFLAGDTQREAEEQQDYGWRSRSLSRNNALEFTLPMEWLDAEMEYSVEMLTMTEAQTLEYVPVTLSQTGLYGTYMDYDLTHNLVLRIGEKLPRAGTYRLNMKWSYEGICYAQTQTTFFINYSA